MALWTLKVADPWSNQTHHIVVYVCTQRCVLFGFCNILDNVMMSHEFSFSAKPAQIWLA